MENEGFYNKFESLPIEAQKQVLTFVDFLNKRYESKMKRTRKRKSIKDNKFVGMWEDRKDLNDSSSWIKNLRKKDWEKIDG
ncbi:MAG: hypothetical protein K8H86_14905 [Ignavibacteriaceae bacterium]|nr:hypothetical protein [Ignavibacteriaceae bacterium]